MTKKERKEKEFTPSRLKRETFKTPGGKRRKGRQNQRKKRGERERERER